MESDKGDRTDRDEPEEAAERVEPKAAPPPENPERKLVWGLFGVALLARVLYLGRADLWGDEVLFAQSAMPPQSPLAVFVLHWERFLAIGHVPLPAMVQNVFLWLMTWFTGDLLRNPLLQRLPAALWGAASVPLIYRFGRQIASQRVALCAAVMLGLFYFPVHFSREAYVYAPLLFFTLASFHMLFRILRLGKMTRKDGILLGLSLVGAAYSHITGAVFLLALLLCLTVLLIVNKYPAGQDPHLYRRTGLRLCLITLAALALVAPFFLQFITHASPHNFQDPISIVGIIRDFLGKIVLGVSMPAEIVAWVLFAVGFMAATRPGPQRFVRFMLVTLTVVTFLFLLYSTLKTQYSSRYFFVIVCPMYVILAMGIEWCAERVTETYKALHGQVAAVTYVLLACLTALHVGLFLPTAYKVKAKARDYGAIAEWLNTNLPPGTPYVLESGYDQRFVPGYFKTPNLVNAVPYIHGPGTEEMLRLRQRQQDFFLRFPEACYVESSRHGSEPGSEYGVWEWPHRFFRREADLRNEPLIRLINMEIYPGARRDRDPEQDLVIPMHYNTAEDIEEIWRRERQPFLFSYDLWQCTQINQYTYARAARGSWAGLRMKNLRGEPLRGKFVLTGGLVAPEQSYDLALQLDGEVLAKSKKYPGQLWSWETPVITVPAGQHTLQWGVEGEPRPEVQALLIVDIHFVEIAEEEAAEEQPVEPLVEAEVETPPPPGPSEGGEVVAP